MDTTQHIWGFVLGVIFFSLAYNCNKKMTTSERPAFCWLCRKSFVSLGLVSMLSQIMYAFFK